MCKAALNAKNVQVEATCIARKKNVEALHLAWKQRKELDAALDAPEPRDTINIARCKAALESAAVPS